MGKMDVFGGLVVVLSSFIVGVIIGCWVVTHYMLEPYMVETYTLPQTINLNNKGIKVLTQGDLNRKPIIPEWLEGKYEQGW